MKSDFENRKKLWSTTSTVGSYRAVPSPWCYSPTLLRVEAKCQRPVAPPPAQRTSTGSLTVSCPRPSRSLIWPFWNPNPFVIFTELTSIIFGSKLQDILFMLNHQCRGESISGSLALNPTWLHFILTAKSKNQEEFQIYFFHHSLAVLLP